MCLVIATTLFSIFFSKARLYQTVHINMIFFFRFCDSLWVADALEFCHICDFTQLKQERVAEVIHPGIQHMMGFLASSLTG